MTEGRTQIILWRHGQTTFNVENRFQGHLDAPLNDVGLAQAEVAAVGLSKLRIDAIYASPLQRAYITAQALAGRVDLPIATDDRLKEIDVGEWEGLYAEDIYRANPEFVLALGEGRDARRSLTGETGTEVAARMAEALREIAAAHLGQTVVVASHGLAIRMGHRRRARLGLPDLDDVGEHVELRLDDAGRPPRQLLEAGHLEPARRATAALTSHRVSSDPAAANPADATVTALTRVDARSMVCASGAGVSGSPRRGRSSTRPW